MLPSEFNSFSDLFGAPYIVFPTGVAALTAAIIFLSSAKFLLIAQQTGYSPRALKTWYDGAGANYKNRLMLLSLMSFLAFCVVGSCFIPVVGENVAAYLGIVPFILFTAIFIKTERGANVKLPFKKTGRAIRLCITYCVVLFVTCRLFCFAADVIAYLVKNDVVALLRYCVIAFIPMLLPFTLTLALAVNKPFEEIRNRRFVERARLILKQSRAVKIGITGSYGKTTVKELLKSMLSECGSVISTPESYNTPLGIALTVKDGVDVDFFIAEMGAKKKGDVKELCDIVMPSVGVLTGINSQHLQSFGSIDVIKKTKFELFEGLVGDKTAVFSADCAGAKALYGRFVGDKYSAGINGDFVRAENVILSENGASFDLVIKGEKPVRCETSLLGKHNVSNLCLAAAVAFKLGASVSNIVGGAAKCSFVPHRLQPMKSKSGGIILDDAYNSSEDGAAAALNVLAEFGGKKIVVTPGLVELGERQEFANEELGKKIAEVADVVVITGKTNAEAVSRGLSFKMSENAIMFADTATAAVQTLGGIKTGEVCLFLNDLPDSFS